MFDRPDSNAAFEKNAEQESVVLVHLDFNDRDFDETQQEFFELVNSTGAAVSAVVHGKRQRLIQNTLPEPVKLKK